MRAIPSLIRLTCALGLLLQPLRIAVAFDARHRVEELLLLHPETPELGPDLQRHLLQFYRNGSIPPIIHQTWKNHEIPALYQQWSATWSKVNQGWLYVIWSDEENRRLVELHYPALLSFYDSLPVNICRVDAIRALILHRYGGVYTDLDSEALRPLDDLVAGKHVVLGQMGNGGAKHHSIPNAFMASQPEQHFWLYFLKTVQQYLARNGHRAVRPENVAGPVALKIAVESYANVSTHSDGITILPPGTVYPIDWSAKKRGEVPDLCDWGGHRTVFNASQCIRLHFPEAYSAQWWTHGWE